MRHIAILLLALPLICVAPQSLLGAEESDKVKPMKVETASAAPESVEVKSAPAGSLEELIAEALRNNNELKATRSGRDVYLGKKHAARKDWFPRLGSYWKYESEPDNQAATFTPTSAKLAADNPNVDVVQPKNPPSQTDRTWRKAYGMTIEQLLWDFGKTRQKVRKEHFLADAEGYKAKAKEPQVAFDVTEAYWRTVFFQTIVAQRKASLESRQKEAKSVADRVAAKNAAPADLKQAEARVGEGEMSLLEAENALKLSKQRLLYFVGRDMEGNIDVQGALAEAAVKAAGEVNVEAHPDMKRIRSSQQAADSSQRAARAGRKPQLSIKGLIEDGKPEPDSLSTGYAPDGYYWVASVNMSVPFGHDWVEASGRLKEAQAKYDQLESEARALKGSIKLKVQHARNDLTEAQKSLDVALRRKAAATAAMERVKQLQTARNATQADVAKAEDEMARTEIGRLRALYDIRVAEAALLREMGRTE